MLLAVAGSLCLVMVVVTSIRAARSRLRYESWHLLHLYAYLGAGLALPHQLWTGQEFLRSTASTVFWWGLWIAAVVSVLVWRVALPLLAVVAPLACGSPRWCPRTTTPSRSTSPVAALHRLQRRGRPVPHLALPRPPRLDPRQPLLALRRARRPAAADHRQGARRRQPLAALADARAPEPWSRVRTAGSPRGRAPSARCC